MAGGKRRGASETPGSSNNQPFDEHILDVDVSAEMRDSFLEYAYSVIYSRALPDARDGLKPVHRRILFMMTEMGLRPDRGHVKSARVVGEVMGKLHPHGDSAIYDALVRMAQPFSMRVPLIDGHGNFGFLDDGPAAMRYTEARLAPPALALTGSLGEDVVDFKPNYDGREREPEVLPAAFPNLLVNGAAGIAVGMATNMPPHNLGEIVAAARHLLAHPRAKLEELMEFVPGPDLATGGRIIGLDGIREAYECGRGTFRIRATATIESLTPRRRGIVVTELPPGVGPERVSSRIKELVPTRKLQGIASVVDYTDRNSGTRLVIEIKSGFEPDAVLEQLYRLTPLEESFGINNVALVEGQPRTLGLRDLLQIYLDHRIEVVRRRSNFRREKAADRLHLVQGLLIAILDIDEVLQVIRSSDDTAQARARLMEVFDLTERQADYILEMPLRRLTRFSRLELEQERDVLERTITELEELLGNEKKLRKQVGTELGEVSAQFATPRRTVLLESGGAAVPTARSASAASLEVPDEPCVVLMSSTGLLARSAERTAAVSGGRARHDVIVSAVPSRTRGEVAVVTSAGRLHRVPVIDLPALPSTAAAPNLAGGAPISEFVELESWESPLCLASLPGSTDGEGPNLVSGGLVPGGLVLGTARGVVKRVVPDHPSTATAWPVIRLEAGDSVVGAAQFATDAPDRADLVFITSEAQLLRFPADSVRPQGRAGGGVAGVRLPSGASVVYFGAVDPTPADAVVVTVAGSVSALPGLSGTTAKVTELDEFPVQGRATGGVRCHRFVKGEDRLVLAWAGNGEPRAAGPQGDAAPLPSSRAKRDGSGAVLAEPVASIGGTV